MMPFWKVRSSRTLPGAIIARETGFCQREQGMKIVVFGATGNVGKQVVAEALRRGHRVTGVVRDPNNVQSPDARINLAPGDATDASSIARIVGGADAVV